MEHYHVKRGLNRIIILPIALSVLYAGVLLWQLERMLDADDWVQHTQQVLTLSSEAQRHIQFQESALRGYLLLQMPLFITQFHREELEVDSAFQELHLLTHDNVVQTRRIDSLMQLYWTWQSSARHSLAAAQTGNRTNAVEDSALFYRAQVAESLRMEFVLLNREETQLYDQRSDRFRRGTTLLIVIIGFASILLGIIIGLNARRQTKRFVDRFTEAIDETTRSRDLLETTLLSIADAIIVTGVDAGITLMNARAEELTGWAQSEARGRAIGDVLRVMDETTDVPVESPVAEVLREHRIITPPGRLKLLSRLGVDYPIDETAAPVHDSHHQIVGVAIVFRDVTEQRENERQTEQREREFRALIENAPDVIIRYARDLTVVYANPAIEQVLGVGPQALIGRRFKDLGIPEPVYAPWEQSVSEVFQTGRGISTEVQYRTMRGLRSYHTRLVPEGDTVGGASIVGDASIPRGLGTDDGGAQTVISISRDITELKQVEQRMRESEQRFRSIIDNSPDAFFMLRAVREARKDGVGTITDFAIEHINGPARELLPVPAGDLLGRRIGDLTPAPRGPEQIEKYRRIVESGVAVREEQHVDPTSEVGERWFQMQYIPIGDIVAISASEITERMQTVRALQRSEERYRCLVEHASEAIFSTDREGRFTYANPYVRGLGGYGDADITKFVFTDLVVKSHRDRVKRHFFRQFLSHAPHSYIEAPFTTKDGSEMWLAVTASLDIQGEDVRGFDCIAMDISQRKQMESELQHIKTHEGQRARQETEHLREQLRKAEHSLAAASVKEG